MISKKNESFYCVYCDKLLVGNQRKFCSVVCSRAYYKYTKRVFKKTNIDGSELTGKALFIND